jgi:acylpyruvate hydrolase
MASIKANCRKVVCIGRNYVFVYPTTPPTDNLQILLSTPPLRASTTFSLLNLVLTASRDHISELGNVKPKQPFWFLKPPTAILPPKSGPVLRPRGTKLHYEVELGLVMGRNVTDAKEEEVLDSIEGSSSQNSPL